jgi:hypothetical protein
MAAWKIGNISLELSGVTRVDANRLGKLIAEKLAAMPIAGAKQDQASVAVSVTPGADISTDRLAELVVKQIVSEVKYSG